MSFHVAVHFISNHKKGTKNKPQRVRNLIPILTLEISVLCFGSCGAILRWISPCMSHLFTEVLGVVYTISKNASGQHVNSALE
jgi:hypothetical protein